MPIPATATGAAAALAAHQLSSVELVTDCLAAVDQLNPDLNAVIWRNDDEALAEARVVDRRRAAGENLPPFAGVPIPVKDLTPVAGWPVTYGSAAAPEGTSAQDELVVARLRQLGFVLCGRTNTPEFGPIPATENLRYGITRNPWDLDRTPGGSSGGAAAAVASGMFPLAHANDGGGSIRIPASCTGLVGLKVSRGRVPARVPGWLGASVEGVLTRSVVDTAAVLDGIGAPDYLGWFCAPPPSRPFVDEIGADPGRLRVALLTRAPLDVAVAEAPRLALAAAGRLLDELGHDVREFDEQLVPPEAVTALISVMHASLADYEGVDFDRAEPHVAASYHAARAVDSFEMVGGLRQLQLIGRAVAARFGADFDLLVTPTMAIEPPPAGSLLAAVHRSPDDLPADMVSMGAFTAPFNVVGVPAISLPLHQGASGLPVGVQLVAGPFGEATLLQVASQIESAEGWGGRVPPVGAWAVPNGSAG